MSRSNIIGHITWITYLNYGTYLQAYALQRMIHILGYDSKIIDDCRFTYLYVSPHQWIRKFFGLFIHPKTNCSWFRSRINQYGPFSRFKRKYLKIDSGWQDKNSLLRRYKGFICGSDQIWSPLLPEQHDGFYFASFADCNKIAYAPSIGCTSIPDSQKDLLKLWLEGFQSINMREEIASKAISELIGKKVGTVLDPTLLLSCDDWKKISRDSRIDEPYILAYFLTYNDTYVGYAKELAKESGYRLITLGDSQKLKDLSDTRLRGIGPDDFLGLIENAEKVVTDSFHGTVFSILFNRPFVTFRRFSETDSRNQNSRIENLFSLLGVDGFYSENDVETGNVEFISNFSQIDSNLSTLRLESISRLKESLEKL